MDIELDDHPPPTASRPLLGVTMLVVEDSRYACEAMRLLCLRSGARIRRADCLRSARRHLQVYRPTVACIDLGLPDGSGADLIAELSGQGRRIEVILGMSGDDNAEAAARAAGADGFLAKPVTGLALFQTEVLRHLGVERHPVGPWVPSNERVEPDRIAFRDDMAHVAEVLSDGDDGALDYVAQFLSGVARSARDTDLVDAAGALARSRGEGRPTRTEVARIAGLVQERLGERAGL